MVETQTQDEMQEAQGEVIVRVDNLTKVFLDFWGRPKARAVNGVNFEVRAGEVFGLLGPNGSGKSTTIKMMLGLLNPTKGFIDMFGQSPRDVKTKERVGYLPEESYLYKYLNSTATLDFFGGLFALAPTEKAVRSKQLLDMVGLTATQMRTVGEFSKGMQRRIGLAQALINDPDLVILDEPTSGLDPVGCREIKDLILNLKARGKTVILSSHLLSDVEDVCDRAVIYYGGKIQQYGTLEELLTERDTLRFTLPALSEEAQQEVMDTISKHVGTDKVRVENPTQNLESFFLNVVENAIAKDEDTSGSTAGNEVAEFLRADDRVPTQAETMLERLTDKEAAQPAAIQEEPKPEEPKVDTAKLESLAGNEAPKEPAKPKQAETKKSQNLDDAEDKLSGLLGGD